MGSRRDKVQSEVAESHDFITFIRVFTSSTFNIMSRCVKLLWKGTRAKVAEASSCGLFTCRYSLQPQFSILIAIFLNREIYNQISLITRETTVQTDDLIFFGFMGRQTSHRLFLLHTSQICFSDICLDPTGYCSQNHHNI